MFKNTLSFKSIIFIVFLLMMTMSCSKNNGIENYRPIPGLPASDVYTVQVNGKSIWTEKFRTTMEIGKLPDWFTSDTLMQKQQEVHIVNFSCDSPLVVEIEASEPIIKAFVRPVSRNIDTIITGNKLKFSVPGPDKLYIEINDLPPLCFFANPAEINIPGEDDPAVRYFGPGVHHAGIINLEDGQTIYIAGGAIVYGGLRLNGTSNIKILGRGILDGGFEHQRMVLLENGSNIEFNGIIIRNGVSWTNTVVNCKNVLYQDVKVISFGPGGDGINPLGSKDMTINECFLRCTDDCIAIKAPDSLHHVKNIKITNNTMIGYAFSDGITIGFETNGPFVEDVTVQNCDILMGRGGSRVDGHSAFSIICDGPAVIQNILFENLRIEERVFKLFELNITDGTKYGINPPGHIRDIYLKNIAWSSRKPIILQGFDDTHKVVNVKFTNCSVAGEKLVDTDNSMFRINQFVENVRFE